MVSGCTTGWGRLLPSWAMAGEKATGAAMAAAATNSAFFMGSTSAAKCREGPAAALQARFAFRRKTIRRRRHEQGQIRQNPDAAGRARDRKSTRLNSSH